MICLPCYYTLLTLCLRFATRAELKEGRERSIFGVAGSRVRCVFSLAFTLFTLCLQLATRAELATTAGIILFRVAGGRVRFAYHLLILCLQFAYDLLPMQT